MIEIHQLVPSFAPRDAIGRHVVNMQRALRRMGYVSEIWYGEAAPEVRNTARPYRKLERYRPTGPMWLLYHASTASPVAEWLVDRPEPKLVDYHNITPATLFGRWEPHVGAELDHGRRQIASLAPYVSLGIADSAFNAAELDAMGYGRTAVVPILIDTKAFEHDVDVATVARLQQERREGAVWLFVSRIAPHKAQHDVVKAFALYRQAYDKGARLYLIGGSSSHRYLTALNDFVAEAGLSDAVFIPGSVPDAVLGAHYREADVYVCLSDHEGFGVPPLEAMAHDVPVVAYGATAIPETVGRGGLVLLDKAPAVVAAAVHRVVTDSSLRTSLVAAGRARLADFALPVTEGALRAAIDSVVEPRR